MMHTNQVKKLERLNAAFTVAKSHEATHPAEYQKAKKELAAYRIKLRTTTSAAPTGDGDAVAKPKTLQVKTTNPKAGGS
jgi:hypothetical protein